MGYYGASHAKMLAYHPDRVANLAEKFQELAHQKTIEIRASYEALLRIVGEWAAIQVRATPNDVRQSRAASVQSRSNLDRRRSMKGHANEASATAA